jgi:hypothetical protein
VTSTAAAAAGTAAAASAACVRASVLLAADKQGQERPSEGTDHGEQNNFDKRYIWLPSLQPYLGPLSGAPHSQQRTGEQRATQTKRGSHEEKEREVTPKPRNRVLLFVCKYYELVHIGTRNCQQEM